MRRVAIAMLLVAPASAHAEGPITAVVGFGPTMEKWEVDDDIARFAVALRADVAYRVHPNIAIGVHGSLAMSASGREFVFLGMDSRFEPIEYAPMELGVGGTFTLRDRIWLAPWLGYVDVQITDDAGSADQYPRNIGFGADVGADVYIRDAHRVAVFAGVTSSTGDVSFLGLTLGAAYRYW